MENQQEKEFTAEELAAQKEQMLHLYYAAPNNILWLSGSWQTVSSITGWGSKARTSKPLEDLAIAPQKIHPNS